MNRLRLPRTRGDRPFSPPTSLSVSSAAPHTRGSTWTWSTEVRSSKGCPAHAGIDPEKDRSGSERYRLPRTRGDRPYLFLRVGTDFEAAPHTRGSTQNKRSRRWRQLGCPAHAGIDPKQASCLLVCSWLPRTRGDRPRDWPPAVQYSTAAPHTRGSTLTMSVFKTNLKGCPAHAGIDPSSRCHCWRWRWLPRTRGDRPYSSTVQSWKEPAAPHTRGSTPSRAAPRFCTPG